MKEANLSCEHLNQYSMTSRYHNMQFKDVRSKKIIKPT